MYIYRINPRDKAALMEYSKRACGSLGSSFFYLNHNFHAGKDTLQIVCFKCDGLVFHIDMANNYTCVNCEDNNWQARKII